MSNSGDIIFIGIVWVIMATIAIVIWFIPSMCAKNNKNAKPVFWINLLLGWIPFVWLILLLAALLGEKEVAR